MSEYHQQPVTLVVPVMFVGLSVTVNVTLWESQSVMPGALTPVATPLTKVTAEPLVGVPYVKRTPVKPGSLLRHDPFGPSPPAGAALEPICCALPLGGR
jgi:hypothetical protein